jgi:hypothetical protein
MTDLANLHELSLNTSFFLMRASDPSPDGTYAGKMSALHQPSTISQGERI